MDSKFSYQWIEESIRFLPNSEDYIDSYDSGPVVDTDSLRSILSELERECWDNIDERGDGTVICYPSDSSQDMVTGINTRNQLIIKAKHPHQLDKLMEIYREQRKRKRAKHLDNIARLSQELPGGYR